MASFRASTGRRRSRLSTHPKGRESIFSGSSDFYRGDAQAVFSPNLRECVLAMEDCCEEAHEAQQFLRNGTYDLPRMTRVLQNERVFLLVDEGTVRRYKTDVAEEIEPQITELIARAEKGLKMLQKKESNLQTKVETAQTRPTSLATVGTTAVNKAETRKLQLLVRQREQLEEQLRQLESEVLATEAKQKQ